MTTPSFLLPGILLLLWTTLSLSQKHQSHRNTENFENASGSGSSRDYKPPNIIILLADNLGYNDIGIFQKREKSAANIDNNSNSKTPNIDSIGNDGMIFHNWNSIAHLCSASRASLLTGKYPIRTGIYPSVFKPDSIYGLMPNETTIPEYLKKMKTSASTYSSEESETNNRYNHNHHRRRQQQRHADDVEKDQDGSKIKDIDNNQEKILDYSTAIVGKWHLGHSHDMYLPTNQGFDEWVGIPYHMSGGSLDQHLCNFDINQTMWLPLYHNNKIIEQPVMVKNLARTYADAATSFIKKNVKKNRPFFLYMSFSHVHQLCAPSYGSEQDQCQFSSTKGVKNVTFIDAVQEMDWISGQILNQVDQLNISDETLVIFTSDNGPWVAEQECSGSKGPFLGKWAQDNTPLNCTACPGHDYVSMPTKDQPRRCALVDPTNNTIIKETMNGIHCGLDTGLGSSWEANVRMPTLIKWPNHIEAGSSSNELVSTLDILPTILTVLNMTIPHDIDGIDITPILFGNNREEVENNDEDKRYSNNNDRVIYFWRDGFHNGPLPQPYGKFDVVAVKVGNIKAWISTKSAHYNPDVEIYHDPPLLFDTIKDRGETTPLDPNNYIELIKQVKIMVKNHKSSIDWRKPLTIFKDSKYIPCFDHNTNCRTHNNIYDDSADHPQKEYLTLNPLTKLKRP